MEKLKELIQGITWIIDKFKSKNGEKQNELVKKNGDNIPIPPTPPISHQNNKNNQVRLKSALLNCKFFRVKKIPKNYFLF